MRNLIILLICVTALACKAQSPILPLYNDNSTGYPPNGHYLKDIDNNLDPFVGEWKWVIGSSSLTIQFVKVEMYHREYPNYSNTGTISRYYDALVGEYQYIENGIEQINLLPIIYNNEYIYDFSIAGYIITNNEKGIIPCVECNQDIRVVQLSFKEPQNPQLLGKIYMTHFIENGIEKIRARIFNIGIADLTAEYTGPRGLKVPEGIYTFIKQ
ncbi:MAG: hypothetical protein NWQ07_05805 [Flaviramulus sp.]|nr:hypothetical protein [Flaviramulus sp.]